MSIDVDDDTKISEAEARPQLPGAVIDGLFFAAGAVATFWFGVLLIQRLSLTWWSIIVVIATWAVLSYLALPRMHRILSAIYVPDYFFGRSRTTDGMLGDPINFAMDGTSRQVHEAMTRSGWILADDITARSTWGIIMSTLTRRSYPEAPVSPLLLFGRQQGLAYQQEVDGNAAQRHHLRLWRCPDGWPLPGGRRVQWLGAGTYDRSVGFSLFTLQVTHKIEADIDIERDFIVDSLVTHNSAVEVTKLIDFSTSYHSRNGGGDRVHTDGTLPIIDVRRVAPADDCPPAVLRSAAGYDDPFESGGKVSPDPDLPEGALIEDRYQRPASLVAGVIAVVIGAVVGFANTLWVLWQMRAEVGGGEETTVILGVAVVVSALLQAIILLLSWLTWKGRARPRTWLMAVSLLTIVNAEWSRIEGDEAITWQHLLMIALNVLALTMLSGPSARRWSRSSSYRRKKADAQAAD